jgi:hypothetical protein
VSVFTPQQRTELSRLLGQLSLLVRSAGTTRQARVAALAEVSTALDEHVRDLRIANHTGNLQPTHASAGEWYRSDPTQADLARLRGQQPRPAGPSRWAGPRPRR